MNSSTIHLNPKGPNSDKKEISLYIITTCSNIQVTRIQEVITKDKVSWYLDKFHKKYVENYMENIKHFHVRASRVKEVSEWD